MKFASLLLFVTLSVSSCQTVTGLGSAALGATKSGIKKFGQLWRNETDDSVAMYASTEGKSIPMNERFDRQMSAMKHYGKNPYGDPTTSGGMFHGANKTFTNNGRSFEKEFLTKSTTTKTYEAKNHPIAGKSWIGSGKAMKTNEYRDAGKGNRFGQRDHELTPQSYRVDEYATQTATEADAAYTTAPEGTYEQKYNAPRTVKDDLIRNVYDKPYDLNDLQKKLGR